MPIKHYDIRFTFDYEAWCYAVFARRCDINATQREFAEAAGVSQGTVSSIERGAWVSFPTIIYLSAIWGLDLMEFLKR